MGSITFIRHGYGSYERIFGRECYNISYYLQNVELGKLTGKTNRLIWLAAASCLAASVVYLSVSFYEKSSIRSNWAWATTKVQGESWADLKGQLIEMPPLPPGARGLRLPDGTFIPRAYFDKPPEIRKLSPPEMGEPD